MASACSPRRRHSCCSVVPSASTAVTIIVFPKNPSSATALCVQPFDICAYTTTHRMAQRRVLTCAHTHVYICIGVGCEATLHGSVQVVITRRKQR
ncbi:hypothetical protein ABB37_09062 [Leptomonas pyrrhocoris]|uniref:Uncharacterized protein n=1 Tax=Leptomonas pyrrhocoris TaxID=157538 RepID=A0A0M9FS65_LEPPY|nr:hypothetical protein ABB37_09062 [Leptomonas pyrrhocoris]KPA74776.1 hypothetical protein ABB37_09062 [Leptomonas pyrrhocoris]|eukprot:XP_015653215.1 hypothetical protein ABB37_09062 [Leptomonas pyrrhocoris]